MSSQPRLCYFVLTKFENGLYSLYVKKTGLVSRNIVLKFIFALHCKDSSLKFKKLTKILTHSLLKSKQMRNVGKFYQENKSTQKFLFAILCPGPPFTSNRRTGKPWKLAVRKTTLGTATQQEGWKTQDGRMTKKSRARPGMHSLARRFFVILPS